MTRGPPPPYCSCAVWGSTCATRPRSACCLPPGSQEQLPSQSLAVSSPRRRQLCRGSGAQESLCTLRNMSGRARVRARGMAPRHGAREVGSAPGNLMVSVSPCPPCGHPGLLLFPDFSLLPRVSTSPPPPPSGEILCRDLEVQKALWVEDVELPSTFLAIIRLGNP